MVKKVQRNFSGCIFFENTRKKKFNSNFVLVLKSKGDVTREDSQQRFLAQHRVVALLRHCFEWGLHCSNIAPTLQRCVSLKLVVANRAV